MIKNKVKKFVAAAGLLSFSSLSAAQGPLEPVTNILVQFTSIGGVAGGGIPGLDALPLGSVSSGGLPGLDALPVNLSAVMGGSGNLISLSALPVSPFDLISAFQLLPVQPVLDLLDVLPLNSFVEQIGGLADVNSLPINPLSLIAGGGLSGVPTNPALLFGLLPSGGELPVDILAFIPI